MTPTELQAALSTEVVPFDPIVAPDDPAWIAVSDLVHADDPTLTSLIDDVAAQRSIDDRVVAATLGWKGFAYLASLMPLAAWSRLGVVPDQHVHNVAVRLDTAPLVGFALRDFRMRGDGSVADAVDVWWGGLMEPLIERWRVEARVGRRSLEALAVSHAVTIVGGSVETGVDDAHDRIEEFVAALPSRLRPMAKPIEFRGADGAWKAIGERTACCLQYKLPDVGYCSTCNLIDDDERTVLIEQHGGSWRRPERQRATS